MSYANRNTRCEASGDKYTAYASTHRKSADHRMPCPVCGKVVKMRKQGIDRYPSTIPTHNRAQP